MDESDHVLEAIDNAIQDWEVSDDAMRWTPESASEKSPKAGWPVEFALNPEWCQRFIEQYEAAVNP